MISYDILGTLSQCTVLQCYIHRTGLPRTESRQFTFSTPGKYIILMFRVRCLIQASRQHTPYTRPTTGSPCISSKMYHCFQLVQDSVLHCVCIVRECSARYWVLFSVCIKVHSALSTLNCHISTGLWLTG